MIFRMEVCYYPEVREAISEDDWLEFVETVKESLQKKLQN
jgi:hypothetical protein